MVVVVVVVVVVVDMVPAARCSGGIVGGRIYMFYIYTRVSRGVGPEINGKSKRREDAEW
jgi:hypothetical protein